MKTILITGINGFLGSHLALYFKKKYNVIGLEYSLNNLFRISNENFTVFSSKNGLNEIFNHNNIDVIIHAATLYRKCDTPLTDVINTNVLLPINLYELGKENKVRLFINTDSFFNNPKYNYTYLPEYTLSKKHAMDWLKLINSSNCKLVNMKIFHMYGLGDAPSKFVPQIINKLRNNQPFIDVTLGNQTRDFIFIEDVVNAYGKILESIDQLPQKAIEYQVGTGEGYSIKNFILKVKKITKSNTEIRFGALEYRENEIMESVAENDSLTSLGWKPFYSLDQGLKKIILNK